MCEKYTFLYHRYRAAFPALSEKCDELRPKAPMSATQWASVAKQSTSTISESPSKQEKDNVNMESKSRLSNSITPPWDDVAAAGRKRTTPTRRLSRSTPASRQSQNTPTKQSSKSSTSSSTGKKDRKEPRQRSPPFSTPRDRKRKSKTVEQLSRAKGLTTSTEVQKAEDPVFLVLKTKVTSTKLSPVALPRRKKSVSDDDRRSGEDTATEDEAYDANGNKTRPNYESGFDDMEATKECWMWDVASDYAAMNSPSKNPASLLDKLEFSSDIQDIESQLKKLPTRMRLYERTSSLDPRPDDFDVIFADSNFDEPLVFPDIELQTKRRPLYERKPERDEGFVDGVAEQEHMILAKTESPFIEDFVVSATVVAEERVEREVPEIEREIEELKSKINTLIIDASKKAEAINMEGNYQDEKATEEGQLSEVDKLIEEKRCDRKEDGDDGDNHEGSKRSQETCITSDDEETKGEGLVQAFVDVVNKVQSNEDCSNQPRLYERKTSSVDEEEKEETEASDYRVDEKSLQYLWEDSSHGNQTDKGTEIQEESIAHQETERELLKDEESLKLEADVGDQNEAIAKGIPSVFVAQQKTGDEPLKGGELYMDTTNGAWEVSDNLLLPQNPFMTEPWRHYSELDSESDAWSSHAPSRRASNSEPRIREGDGEKFWNKEMMEAMDKEEVWIMDSSDDVFLPSNSESPLNHFWPVQNEEDRNSTTTSAVSGKSSPVVGAGAPIPKQLSSVQADSESTCSCSDSDDLGLSGFEAWKEQSAAHYGSKGELFEWDSEVLKPLSIAVPEEDSKTTSSCHVTPSYINQEVQKYFPNSELAWPWPGKNSAARWWSPADSLRTVTVNPLYIGQEEPIDLLEGKYPSGPLKWQYFSLTSNTEQNEDNEDLDLGETLKAENAANWSQNAQPSQECFGEIESDMLKSHVPVEERHQRMEHVQMKFQHFYDPSEEREQDKGEVDWEYGALKEEYTKGVLNWPQDVGDRPLEQGPKKMEKISSGEWKPKINYLFEPLMSAAASASMLWIPNVQSNFTLGEPEEDDWGQMIQRVMDKAAKPDASANQPPSPNEQEDWGEMLKRVMDAAKEELRAQPLSPDVETSSNDSEWNQFSLHPPIVSEDTQRSTSAGLTGNRICLPHENSAFSDEFVRRKTELPHTQSDPLLSGEYQLQPFPQVKVEQTAIISHLGVEIEQARLSAENRFSPISDPPLTPGNTPVDISPLYTPTNTPQNSPLTASTNDTATRDVILALSAQLEKGVSARRVIEPGYQEYRTKETKNAEFVPAFTIQQDADKSVQTSDDVPPRPQQEIIEERLLKDMNMLVKDEASDYDDESYEEITMTEVFEACKEEDAILKTCGDELGDQLRLASLWDQGKLSVHSEDQSDSENATFRMNIWSESSSRLPSLGDLPATYQLQDFTGSRHSLISDSNLEAFQLPDEKNTSNNSWDGTAFSVSTIVSTSATSTLSTSAPKSIKRQLLSDDSAASYSTPPTSPREGSSINSSKSTDMPSLHDAYASRWSLKNVEASLETAYFETNPAAKQNLEEIRPSGTTERCTEEGTRPSKMYDSEMHVNASELRPEETRSAEARPIERQTEEIWSWEIGQDERQSEERQSEDTWPWEMKTAETKPRVITKHWKDLDELANFPGMFVFLLCQH